MVGSCTGEKDVRDCPYLLTEMDLSLRSHNSAARIIVMNALQRNDMSPYAILANDWCR